MQLFKRAGFRPVVALATVIVALAAMIPQGLFGQSFKGYSAFKKLIEFESQRFLMEEKLQISSSNFEELRIDKRIEEIDDMEGFMFVLTCYRFKETCGVVLTAFNSQNLSSTTYGFRNVHLAREEFIRLHDIIVGGLGINHDKGGMQYVRRFNDRIIVDIYSNATGTFVTLWIDGLSRHTFTEEKWGRAHKRFQSFLEK